MNHRGTVVARVIAMVAIATSIAGCGTSGKTAAPAVSIVGHTFVSTKVTGHTLVSGTRVTLSFGRDATVTANASCNTMSAKFLVAGGRLVIGQVATTLIGCPAGLGQQDAWLASVLGARPQIVQSGATLRLTTGATTIELAES